MGQFISMNHEVKQIMKGFYLKIVGCMVGVNIIAMLLNIIMSIFMTTNLLGNLTLSLLASLIIVLMNNMIYFMFIKRIRKETFSKADVNYSIQKIVPQIGFAILISILQSFTITMIFALTSTNAIVNMMLTLLCTTFFSMVSVVVAFCIYDGHTTVKTILHFAVTLIVKEWKSLLIVLVLFIVWNYAYSIIMSSILFNFIQEAQGVNNILHTILLSGNALAILEVIGLYVINFSVGSFLQANIFMQLAYAYEMKKFPEFTFEKEEERF